MSKIAIIDIETTGFSKTKDKIVEVGIVSLDLLNGDTEIVFDEIIHEPGVMDIDLEKTWIFRNSNIGSQFFDYDCKSLEMNESPEKSFFSEIQGIINSFPVGCTAFNNSFDFGFMHARGFVFPKKLRDPMKICKEIFTVYDKNGRVKFPNVEEAYKHFFPNINYIEKHRGADDALHESKIAYEIYKLGLF